MALALDLWNSTVETFTSTEPWREANLGDFGRGLEQLTRAAIPGESMVEDYFVGVSRIATGRVGDDGNPTWSEAWAETDREIGGGWLPGGAENPLNNWWDEHKDDVKDTFKGLGALVIAAAAIALRGRK